MSIPYADLAWRVEGMRAHLAAHRAEGGTGFPLLEARPPEAPRWRRGVKTDGEPATVQLGCQSCGAPGFGRHGRCPPCAQAARVVVRSA